MREKYLPFDMQKCQNQSMEILNYFHLCFMTVPLWSRRYRPDCSQAQAVSMMHKRHLLMYYDRRFQKDHHFPFIAFNHEQMKKSTTAGFLTGEKQNFHDITDRLVNVNLEYQT